MLASIKIKSLKFFPILGIVAVTLYYYLKADYEIKKIKLPPVIKKVAKEEIIVKPAKANSISASNLPTKKKTAKISLGEERDEYPSEHPFQVRIFDTKSKEFCGGVIYNDRYVLSAAHCFLKSNPEDAIVYVGNRENSDDDPFEEQRFVETYIRHPHFDVKTLINDILLIKLKSPLDFNHRISPPIIPRPGFVAEGHAQVIGWGFHEFGKNTENDKALHSNYLELMHPGKCQSNYTGFQTDIYEGQICAVTTGSRICIGEHGDPLIYGTRRGKYVIGLLSYGDTCSAVPTVFTRVSHYTKWIRAHAT